MQLVQCGDEGLACCCHKGDCAWAKPLTLGPTNQLCHKLGHTCQQVSNPLEVLGPFCEHVICLELWCLPTVVCHCTLLCSSVTCMALFVGSFRGRFDQNLSRQSWLLQQQQSCV